MREVKIGKWITIDMEKHGMLIPGHPNFDLDWYLKFLCRDIEVAMDKYGVEVKEDDAQQDLDKEQEIQNKTTEYIINIIKTYKRGK